MIYRESDRIISLVQIRCKCTRWHFSGKQEYEATMNDANCVEKPFWARGLPFSRRSVSKQELEHSPGCFCVWTCEQRVRVDPVDAVSVDRAVIILEVMLRYDTTRTKATESLLLSSKRTRWMWSLRAWDWVRVEGDNGPRLPGGSVFCASLYLPECFSGNTLNLIPCSD